MKKLYNKNLIIIIIVCLGFGLEFMLGYFLGNNELRKNAIIKEQQNLISSYVNLEKVNQDNKCDWLYDFYLEHAKEDGAYE